MNKILYFLILVLFPFLGLGNDLYFKHITGENGLSVNNVKVICQDSFGFMWFGTRNRLNRYDGITIKEFECYDKKLERGDNSISALYEDNDKKLWVGTDKGVFLFDPIKEIFHAFTEVADNQTEITGWISAIQQDLSGKVWIVAPSQGVFSYDAKVKELKHYPLVKNLNANNNAPQSLLIDSVGAVWVGTVGAGIYRYDPEADDFLQFLRDGSNTLEGKNVISLAQFKDELILGMHEGGLFKFNGRLKRLVPLAIPELDREIIRYIRTLENGQLWVGTQAGIFILDQTFSVIKHVSEDFLDPKSLSDNIIDYIYQDKEGGLWVGTNSGGVNYLPSKNSHFEKYYPTGKKLGINSKRLRQLIEDRNGQIWITSEDNGMWRFNPENQSFTHMKEQGAPRALSVLENDGEIWAGYYKEPLSTFSIADGRRQIFAYQNKELTEETVTAIIKDRKGRIWLGNTWGMYLANDAKSAFNHLAEFGQINVFDIVEDRDGWIWVSTMGSGVFLYKAETKQITHFVTESSGLSSNSVTSITEDHKGQIWFATDRGGICMYDKSEDIFTSFSMQDGLPDDSSYKILEDDRHNLWFGTNHGLVCFDPSSKEVRVFTKKDGLLSDQFNYRSALIAQTGKMYFGNQGGLIAFDPSSFKVNTFVPPVYITSVAVNNIEVRPNDQTGILKHSLLNTELIQLSYEQSSISLGFVSLSYVSPESNHFSYKLEGIDQDWMTTNMSTVSYTKLPPGRYKFMVKGSNNDNVWNEEMATLHFVISPPWWISTTAYMIYILITLLVGVASVRSFLRRQRQRNLKEKQEFERQKEHELYQSKIDMFTDIAHEIRTPVTLITAPVESLLQSEAVRGDDQQNLTIIYRNAKQLLSLTNQLLDFRRIDANKYLLYIVHSDIKLLLQETLAQFVVMGEEMGKRVTSELPKRSVFVDLDQESFVKIFNNLLSNALKYAKKEIHVKLYESDTTIHLRVENDGDVIPESLREKIFAPFFRVPSHSHNTPGTGIGLSLVRSLVELHQGMLYYIADNEKNVFIVDLPKSLGVNSVVQGDPQALISTTMLERTKSLHITLLLVEDNIDMRKFLEEQMKRDYNVLTAANGYIANELLKEHKVDVVISDVMMPGMDGFELANLIKSDVDQQHILTILLTAKNDTHSKIKGLEIGIDAYVEKPFSIPYMKTLVSSLLKNRKREMKLFADRPYLNQWEEGLSKIDRDFLDGVSRIIQDNMQDEDFSVEMLAQLCNISRSSLHRKLKNLIEKTPLEIINQMRMQKAAQLTLEGNRVNEICYRVGMKSPSYFIKTFHKKYGMTPKEYGSKFTSSREYP